VTETAYYVHIVLGLRLPGITVCYYFRFLHIMFSALPLLGFHSLAPTPFKGNSNFTRATKLF